jgi:mono/diheme cytochrome c family protein
MLWNLLLALLLALSAAGHFLLRNDPTQPNVEALPEMVRSVAFESYSTNPNFRDGKTLQQPPPHTVARGARVFPYGPTEQEAARAGRELANPFPTDDAAVLERGAARFQTFCQHCHGATGRGDGPVAMRGFPAPPPLNSETSLKLEDGRIFHIITYGQKNMPAHRGQIPPDDRWRIVAHVRSLQKSLQNAVGEAKP